MNHLATTIRRQRLEVAAIAALALAGIADAWSTHAGLARGLHESNGLASSAFSALGQLPVFALRVVLPALAAWGIMRAVRRDRVLQIVTFTVVLAVAAGWCVLAVRNASL